MAKWFGENAAVVKIEQVRIDLTVCAISELEDAHSLEAMKWRKAKSKMEKSRWR